MAIKGMAKVKSNVGRILLKGIPNKAEAAMHVATSIIGGYANMLTPVDTGTLAASQYRRVFTERGKVVGAIGYTTRYAAWVHEMSGKLKGQPRAHFGKTRAGVEFGGGTKRGNYWDPDAEPEFLTKAGDDNASEIDNAVQRAMKL